ncbi:MAG: biotin carboxylase [Solirubrobacteraceae bacterium]
MPEDPAARTLHGISEIRAFLRTNLTPIYFISPTPFNLLGLDRWVRNLFYLTFFDSFEGSHPRVFVPRTRQHAEFHSIEDVCNHLLRDRETLDFIAARGPGGKACFVMFDEETEALAHKAGLDVIHPDAELRHRLDSKIITTQLGDEAGIPSVPNTIGHATTYKELLRLAKEASLGEDLVVQTPYGDSGKTTFFIASASDWERHADELIPRQLKVMKRIRNREVAVEASITRHGTIVGPFMTSLIGHKELTPYKGGWCGNDIFPDALSAKQGKRARELTQRLGARLAQEGYRGFFEVDFLVDLDTKELYLGELNPRVSGASSMTNVTAGAYADIPLFLFHLLEYMGVDYELDVDEINQRWARSAGEDVWSQLIIKETCEETEMLTSAPRTGVWKLGSDGALTFARWANDWHNLLDESEAFYLRVASPGDYRFKGADLGVLLTRGRLQDDDGKLTGRCHHWIDGIKAQFAGTPVAPAEVSGAPLEVAFKKSSAW